jgi:hypothetical protein
MTLRWKSPLVIWTAPLAYRGEDRLDVSPLTCDPLGHVFALPVALENAYLRHRGTRSPEADGAWCGLVTRYTDRMRASLRTSLGAPEGPWQTLLGRREATLVCFCLDPARCHRSVLAELLTRCGAQLGGERREQAPKPRHARHTTRPASRSSAGRGA